MSATDEKKSGCSNAKAANVPVLGPITYLHFMHPETKKEIILCGDEHIKFDETVEPDHKRLLSFWDWVTRTARCLAPKPLDLFLELHYTKSTYRDDRPQEGYLFGALEKVLHNHACLSTATVKECGESLAEEEGLSNLRIHSIDLRESSHGLAQYSVLRNAILQYLGALGDGDVEGIANAIALIKQQSAGMLQSQNVSQHLWANQFHMVRKTKIGKQGTLTDTQIKTAIADINELSQARNPRPVSAAVLEQDLNVKTWKWTNAQLFYRGRLTHVLKELRDGIDDMSVARAVFLADVLLDYVTPAIDLYGVARFLKPYVQFGIVYAGQYHVENMAVVLQRLGFELTNQSPHRMFLDTKAITYRDDIKSSEAFIRSIELDIPIKTKDPNSKEDMDVRDFKRILFQLPRLAVRWQLVVHDGHLAVIYEDANGHLKRMRLHEKSLNQSVPTQQHIPTQFQSCEFRAKEE